MVIKVFLCSRRNEVTIIFRKKDTLFLILGGICIYSEWYAVGIWCLIANLLIMGIDNGVLLLYKEIITDYPAEYCVKPRLFKKIFEIYQTHPNKGVPREIYYGESIQFIGFWIYTIIAFGVLFFDSIIAFGLGIIYFLFMVVVSMWELSFSTSKSFKARYKILNRYNIKYIFFTTNVPNPRKVGKCRVVETYKKRRKIFATIKMLDDQECIRNVLFAGSEKQGRDPIYQLYEICKVKYII